MLVILIAGWAALILIMSIGWARLHSRFASAHLESTGLSVANNSGPDVSDENAA